MNDVQTIRQASDRAAGEEVVARLRAADRTAAVDPHDCPGCARIARELRRNAERWAAVQLAEHDGCGG